MESVREIERKRERKINLLNTREMIYNVINILYPVAEI